jgi:hypothetical protein
MLVFETKGVLNFEPIDRTKKQKNQSSWKRTALIETDCDLERYYAWFLEKRFSLKLNKTIRGTHISFINDRVDFKLFEEASKFFNGKEIKFYYEVEPKTNGKHWWVRIYSPDAENIRESMGLSRHPYFGLHLTLGYANDKYLDHSQYIERQCVNFNLLSDEKRVDFSKLILVK